MKEGWEYKALGECCDILDAQRKPIKKDKRVRGTIPYYGATGLLDYVKDYIFDETLVLLGEDGAKWGAGEASAYEISGKSWVNNHAHVLRPNKDEIINAWLIYYLNYANLMPYIKGVTVPKLNQQRMSSIRVPIPPLSEQQRIVSYLDSAFAKIDAVAKNAENSLNEAKALFQSALAKMMEPKEGWMETKLGNVCDIERGGSPRPIKEYITDDPNGLNWIKIGDTDKNGKYIYSTKEKIKPEGLKKSRWVEENDFLLSNSMSYGRPYILKTNGCIHDGWLVLRKYDATFVIDFLYYLLISSSVQSQFHEKAQGSTVSNLNSERVADVVVAFPDKSEQQKIVSTLDSIKSKVDQLQSNLSHTLAECEALKQAILRQTFE